MATGHMYSKLPLNAFNGNISPLGDVGTDIKCMLCTSDYVPNQDDHEDITDITNEVSGTNYVAGGASLENKEWETVGRVSTFKASAVEWTDSTVTARYAVVYDNTPAADADKKLLFYIDFETDKSTSDGLFRIAWATAGIFSFTVPV